MPAVIPRRIAFFSSLLASLNGCGGATPLLHPAHVEPQGIVITGAGVSSQFALGSVASAIQSARDSTAPGVASGPEANAHYRRGALALASIAPAVAPWAGARVGLGFASEGGLTYTARTLRVDARHAFESGLWALSVGLGGHGVLSHRGEGNSSTLPGLNLDDVNGYGVDLPVLGGWRSLGGIYSFWGGVRVGYERLGGQIGLGEASLASSGSTPGTNPLPLSADRYWGGGVVGLTVGFRHVFVALELDASYHHVKGTLGKADSDAAGMSVAPAGALLGRF